MKWAAAVLTLFLVLAPAATNASTSHTAGSAFTYAATSPLAPEVRDVSPIPGTTVKDFFPRFSATIDSRTGAPLRRDSLRLYVDGVDVTTAATLTGDTLTYTPRAHLQAGWHDVFLEGADTSNRDFSGAWVFQSQNPDIDVPVSESAFTIHPAGGTLHRHGAFMHFFLISPFDGFGVLQLCGLEAPFTQAPGSPVFIVTVPVTLGTVLFGCNPGVLFTPFGIGEIDPFFFPLEVAGPGFFQPRAPIRPLTGNAAPSYRSVMPVYRSTVPLYRSTMPVYRLPGTAMPVYRSTGTMPIYRTTTVPAAASGSRVTMPVMPKAPHCCGAFRRVRTP